MHVCTYIHQQTLARLVGTSSSLHIWCKNKVVPNDTVVAQSSISTSSKNTQPTISQSFLLSNPAQYTKLFHSVLFLLEEELAFIEPKPNVKLKKANGLLIMSANKINYKGCAELAENF